MEITGGTTAVNDQGDLQVEPGSVNGIARWRYPTNFTDDSNVLPAPLTISIQGLSNVFSVAKVQAAPKPCVPTPDKPCIDTGGTTVSSVPIFIGTGLLALGLAAWFIRRRGLFITNK